jgi:4-hydroxy-3-polyprenylbenzoate decarboxylase
MIVVSGNLDIRNYLDLLTQVFVNVDFRRDLLFSHGPLDVLDHSSDTFSFGGKVGVDATVKEIEEKSGSDNRPQFDNRTVSHSKINFLDTEIIKSYNTSLSAYNIPLLIISVNRSEEPGIIEKIRDLFLKNDPTGTFRTILIVDHTVDVKDMFMVTWQLLGNSDPFRDHELLPSNSIMFDGTIKAYRQGGFPRRWPNIVCSDTETISIIDQKWESLGIGEFISSPSARYISLCRKGTDAVMIG